MQILLPRFSFPPSFFPSLIKHNLLGFQNPKSLEIYDQSIKIMTVNLTAGAMSLISSNEWQPLNLKPVVQVIDIQTENPAGDVDVQSCRVLLSDCSFHQPGMLVRSHQLHNGSIVQLIDYFCDYIHDQITIIITNLTVILTECDIIGDPMPFLDVYKTISQIKYKKLGTFEKPNFIRVNATIWFIKGDNFCYTVCPNMIGEQKCSEEVDHIGDRKWRCYKCNQTVDECDFVYYVCLLIQDSTGMTWVTASDEIGEDIMGVSAKDLYFVKYVEKNDDKFAEIVRNVLFSKFSFMLKVKEEFFVDEWRVRSTIVKAEKIKFSADTKKLLLDFPEKVSPGSVDS